MKKILALIIGSCTYLIATAQPEPANNVGIGTTNPTRARLEVNGAVGTTSAIFGGDNTGISLQRNLPAIGFNSYSNGGDMNLEYGYGAKFTMNPNTGLFSLDMMPFSSSPNSFTGTPNRGLTIDYHGFVSIGNVIPNAQLQLDNLITHRKIVLWDTENNDHQYFGFGIEPGTLRYNVGSVGSVHRFYSGTSAFNSKVLMSIWGDRTVTIGDDTGGGKLGINLGSPQYTLHIKQAGGTGLCIQEATFNTTWQLQATSFVGGTSNHLNLIHQGGTVGQFFQTGTYTAVSDRRLKTNIKEMPAILNKVMELKPVLYEMIRNNPGHRISSGFIAQDVKLLFPELVYINENTGDTKDSLENLHTLDYSGFGVLAIKAIQEQQQMISDLQKRIDVLEEQNKKILQLLEKNK